MFWNDVLGRAFEVSSMGIRVDPASLDRQLTEAGTGLNRLFLHAAALKFTHPGTGEVMRIEAPMDEGLKRCLQKLRNAR